MECSPPWNPWKEYWSRLSCPPPGYHPDSGITPRSPVLQADSLPPEPPVQRSIYKCEQRFVISIDFQILPYSGKFPPLLSPLPFSKAKPLPPPILALTGTFSLHSGFAKLHTERSPSGSHLGLAASLAMQP